MKKLLLGLITCFALVLVPALALSGCGKKSGGENKTATKKHTVTFVSENSSSVSLVEDGQMVKSVTAAKKENHKFDSWYTEKNGTELYNFNSPVTQSITLYARYYDSNLTMATESDHAYAKDCKEGATSAIIPEIYHGLAVTEIGRWTFSQCSQITNINIPNTVEAIGEHAFFGCTSLTSLTLPEGLKTIDEWAFRECGIVSIVIPNSVISIGVNIFSICSNLEEVSLPNTLSEIPSALFTYCNKLESVTVPASVKKIGHFAFGGNGSNEIGINFLGTLNDWCKIEFDQFAYKWLKINGEEVTTITAEDLAGIETIKPYTFVGEFHFTSITIPENVEKIEYDAFNQSVGMLEINTIIIDSKTLYASLADDFLILNSIDYCYVQKAIVDDVGDVFRDVTKKDGQDEFADYYCFS